MRVAFVGTRGIPARYSGFETFVEHLGARLVERGHTVTVYCRKHHSLAQNSTYRGMTLRYVGGLRSKHFDTISHTLVACLDAFRRDFDVVIMCISGNSPAAILPRLGGMKVVLNVDGSDWRRRKWGRLARAYIRESERLAVLFPHVTVTDSKVMHSYYLDRFGADTECITYGADMPMPSSTDSLVRLGLEPRGYFLLVGRLVPENCAEHLVEAYERLQTNLRCVVVGDAPYAASYIKKLKRDGPNVVFPGYVFGDGYRELMHNAYAVVLCSEVGGTHPVLVEAMAAGNCVIVNDTPANLEVIADSGLRYDGKSGAASLQQVLEEALAYPDLVAQCRELARARAEGAYNWDAVTDRYEELCTRLLGSVTHIMPATEATISETAEV